MSDSKQISLDKLKTLIEINSKINLNYADPDVLLFSIMESVRALVKCESGAFVLNNKEKGILEFAICLGVKSQELKKMPISRNGIIGWVVENKKPIILDDPNSDSRFYAETFRKIDYPIRNLLAVPLMFQGNCFGVIDLRNKIGDEGFTEDDLEILTLFGKQAITAYLNSVNYRERQNQFEILQNAFDVGKDYHPFFAKNPVVLSLIENIKEAASINSSVLIVGESGVGKELFAEQVHLLSTRKDKPFVRVSCASLSPPLLESELFGHVKGAFTDAVSSRKGRFEVADKGTIFLDEIGELPLSLQAKLLRVIQERKFERVGSSDTISVDVRIIAATNRNLENMVKEGTFRGDLYYRLNVLPINVPPLRERRDEIPGFCDFFLKKFKNETHKDFVGLSEGAKTLILSYMWPGNIRELENAIERACIIGTPPFIKECDLQISQRNLPSSDASSSYSGKYVPSLADIDLNGDRSLKNALNKFKRSYLIQVLNETKWNQTAAARILDVQRTYVSKLITDLDIQR